MTAKCPPKWIVLNSPPHTQKNCLLFHRPFFPYITLHSDPSFTVFDQYLSPAFPRYMGMTGLEGRQDFYRLNDDRYGRSFISKGNGINARTRDRVDNFRKGGSKGSKRVKGRDCSRIRGSHINTLYTSGHTPIQEELKYSVNCSITRLAEASIWDTPRIHIELTSLRFSLKVKSH